MTLVRLYFVYGYNLIQNVIVFMQVYVLSMPRVFALYDYIIYLKSVNTQ